MVQVKDHSANLLLFTILIPSQSVIWIPTMQFPSFLGHCIIVFQNRRRDLRQGQIQNWVSQKLSHPWTFRVPLWPTDDNNFNAKNSGWPVFKNGRYKSGLISNHHCTWTNPLVLGASMFTSWARLFPLRVSPMLAFTSALRCRNLFGLWPRGGNVQTT